METKKTFLDFAYSNVQLFKNVLGWTLSQISKFSQFKCKNQPYPQYSRIGQAEFLLSVAGLIF